MDWERKRLLESCYSKKSPEVRKSGRPEVRSCGQEDPKQLAMVQYVLYLR